MRLIDSPWLGSVLAITDATGALVQRYTYEPFGAIRSQTGSLANPWTFTGRPLDAESGLYFLRHRSYDPRTGTFTTPDPIGIAGGINLYAYVGNSPLNFTDPFGREPNTDLFNQLHEWLNTAKLLITGGGAISMGGILIYVGGITITGTWSIPGANLIGVPVGVAIITAGGGLIYFGGEVIVGVIF